MKDKVSGALLKLKGSLTRRPGVKVCFYSNYSSNNINLTDCQQAAGTRRMRGTDGRGSHRRARHF